MNTEAKVNDNLCFVANLDNILTVTMADSTNSILTKIDANMHVGRVSSILANGTGSTDWVCTMVSDGSVFNNIQPVCLGTGTTTAAQTNLKNQLSTAIKNTFDFICNV